jgi:hypothetical protein
LKFVALEVTANLAINYTRKRGNDIRRAILGRIPNETIRSIVDSILLLPDKVVTVIGAKVGLSANEIWFILLILVVFYLYSWLMTPIVYVKQV